MFFFKEKKRDNPPPDTPPRTGGGSPVELEPTVLLDADVQAGKLNQEDAQFTIRLSDPARTGKTWEFPVSEELLIGRAEHCHIQFHDQSVSRVQCKITVQDGALVVVQVGSTNPTKHNGMAVTGCVRLDSGDMLKFGREALRIDSIWRQETPEPPEYPGHIPFDPDDDRTMSFF